MKRELIDKQPFEFSARVTLQLGRESISSSTVAISELIKNSYDADAKNVDIAFYLRESAVSTLAISDDGDGMNLADLVDKWLTVGTNNKSTKKHTRSKTRILTGAKGLGRLGIDRLCKKLILYTKTENMDHAIQLVINWNSYENTDSKLSDIQHEIYKVSLPIKDKYGQVFLKKSDKGTRMLLVGLKDKWHETLLDSLENELRLLISPFYSKNDFSINLSSQKTGEEKHLKKLASEEFLNLAKWEVLVEIDSEGNVSEKYVNRTKKIEKKHEKIPWQKWIKGAGETPSFGPLELRIYYIPQDTDVLKQVKLKTKDFRRFMHLNRGVRIYRDQFRVRPYGEPSGKGDWLDLGYRKASNPAAISREGWRVGPNQLLGAILISRDENSILNDQANREGIVENRAFFQLRTFVLKIINNFEALAHKDAKEEEFNELPKSLEIDLEQSNSEAIQAANNLSTLIRPNAGKSSKKKKERQRHLIQKRIVEFEKAQKKAEESQKQLFLALQQEKRQLQEQKDTLSNLASLGILTVCFGHEIRQHTSQASANALEIEDIITDAQKSGSQLDFPECQKLSEIIRKNIKYIERFSQLTLSNIKPDKRKRKKINIPKVFEYVFSLMEDTFKATGIEYELSYENISRNDVNVHAFEIDWESIAINLITNSIWAMENTPKKNRLIQVDFGTIDKKVIEIKFRDSGLGLEAGTEEQIFLPMNSNKRDQHGNIIGTGMGLSIIKNHIEEHNSGEVSATATSSIGGAEFTFKLPAS
ncbi:sensor histidine kinase [Microbulbifer hainanensis]|uniref:sensor histidine kinase n=1 Tax=Microbulbifer hainanensis TaxID=2735675 RepID=UPI0018681E98|nr:ATP-binding protein [Microbulbifer hainanensis]